MGKHIRALAILFVLGPLAAMLSEPFFEAIFDILGWNTEVFAPAIVSTLSKFSYMIESEKFSWTATAMIAFGLGVWGHWLAVRFDTGRPTKEQEFRGLHDFIMNVQAEHIEAMKEDNREVNFYKRNRAWDLQLRALYAELRRVGIRAPNYDDCTDITYNLGHYAFLQTIEPFSGLGLLTDAKREAKKTHKEVRAANNVPQ